MQCFDCVLIYIQANVLIILLDRRTCRKEGSIIKLESNDFLARQYNKMILLHQRVELIFAWKLSLETKDVGKVP